MLTTHTAVAQTNLNDNGAGYEISYTGAYEDYLIPADAETGILSFFLQGADGGSRNSCTSNGKGGQGAEVETFFRVGTGDGDLQPGGTIRFVVGGKGSQQNSDGGGGAGGGGGTAVLYHAPGATLANTNIPSLDIADADTRWILLAVAGGGGGTFGIKTLGSVVGGCDEEESKNGTGANDATNGTGGGGNNAGGIDGNGGLANVGGGNDNDGGAGGGYLTNGGPSGFSLGGRMGGVTGGNGGTGGIGVQFGGWGYGGGGAGFDNDGGGGGGGGFSGGGGGNDNDNEFSNNGGGGGSFVNSAAIEGSTIIISRGATQFPENGYIIYAFPKMNTTGAVRKLDLVNRVQDYVIPEDLDTDVVDAITFTARGGDGGRARTGGRKHTTGLGGDGAMITASFAIGNGLQQLQPGGTLRFIVGRAGNSMTADQRLGGGGGGGTAVLYRPPGVALNGDCVVNGSGGETQPGPSLNIDDECWSILLVAGGGGGGYHTGYDSSNEGRNGLDANTGVDGTSNGDTGDGNPGTGGNSGESPPGNSGNTVRSGGGGGYLPLFPEGSTVPHPAQGSPGNFTGGPGGTGNNHFIAGGFGYGAGGSGRINRSDGLHGGGGGGGFSGGGGGQSDPGGGGGSFVNFGALTQTIEEAPKSNASLDGCLSYQFYKRTTTGPVANCTSTITVAIQGDEEFVLTPDMVDAGSYDPNDPDADLDLSFCVPFGPETLCDIPQMSFICENIGQTFTGRLLKVSDSVNENYCAFTINVIAGDVGTLTCPDPQTVVLAPVGCTADLQDQTEYNGSFSILKTLTRPTCSDDLTYQIVDPDLNLTSGTGELEQFTFPLGTSTVTYFSNYPDEGGEASGQSCSFTVTVEPFASTPTIHCPNDLTVSIDEGGICDLLVENGSGTRISPFPAFDGPGDLNYHIVGPGDDPTITDGFGPLSDFDFEVGTSTVTYTATCGALELTSCAFTVTVENDFNAPPSLTCVDTEVNRLVLDISAGADKQLIIDQIVVSESDDCGITSREVEFLDLGPIQLEDFNCADVGENLRATVTVYDAQGEFASCDVRITVADNLGVTCPPDVTVVANPGDCSGTVSADLLEAASTYLCNTALDYEISFSEGGSVTSGSGNIPAQVLGAGHTYVAVYTAENSLGATSNCSFNISVVDDEAPVAVCNDIDIDLTDDPAAAAAAVGEGSTDNCTIASYSLDLDIACENVGLQSIVLTVTDAAGNQAACSALVQLKDSSVPVIGNCPVQVLVGMNEGACNFTVPDLTQSSFILSGLTDACAGEITLTQSPAVGQLVEGESIEVSLYAADEFGNETESPCVVTVTGQDNQGPVALCQNVTIQLDANGNGSTTAAAVNNGSSDACGIQSTVLSKQSFSCADVGSNTVTLTVTDVNNNASTCTATVTVGDNIAPTALCQNVTVQLNASGTGSTTAAAVNNGSSDACGIQSAVLSKQSFSCADVGANTVTLTVTDPSNHVSTCTATVTVEDNVAPTALCQNVTVQLNGGGTGSTTAESVNNGSSDACGVQSAVLSGQSFSCSDVGANTVTLTVTDVNGNVSTCTATVTVENSAGPSALCQNVTVQLDASGNGATTASAVDNGSGDVCSAASVSLSLSQTDFDCSDAGENTVTLTVTDENNNASTCTATVTVADNVAPTALCQNATVQLDVSGNGFTTAAAVNNGSSDACGVQSTVLSQQAFSCGDVGANTVTLTVTDVNGNASTCTATVTVEDNVAPAALCQNVTVQLNSGGTGSTTAESVNNGSSDACGVQSAVLSQQSFSCGDVGANTVTLTVTDVNGNVSTCTATVTVEDNVAPAALCQNVTVQLDASGNGATTASAVNNGSGDVCSAASVSLSLSRTDFDCNDVGGNTVTLTVTDENNNTSTCTATVTVTDNVAPTALCQNATVQLDASGNGFTTAAAVNNGSSDACGVQSTVLSQQAFSCGDVGANTVTLTVTDVNGNASTCTATVTVEDNVAPAALCQNVTVQLIAGGTGSTTAESVNNGSSDACGIQSTVLNEQSFSCGDVGANTVTLTVTDINGNASTCTATVTVEDNVAPTALCQNVTIQLDAAGNGATTASAVDNGSGDACSTAPVGLSLSRTDFDCSDVGGNTVTLTVTGVNDNTSTCTATVTVEDNVAPTALCQNATVQLDASGNGSTTAAAVNNGSSDACGVQSAVLSQQAFSCGDVGANTVTLTVTDVNGNASTCTATVTVEDNVAPTALCQNVTVQLNAGGTGSTTASAVNNGSSDACGIQSTVLSGQSFSCGDVGANTVTLTVTDVNGNASTCTATVTIEDNVAPAALCQNVTVQLDANGNGSTTTEAVDNGSNDACGVQSVSLNRQSFTCADAGTNTVTLAVTDQNGNASMCTATVTVEDNVGPTALCRQVTVQLDANGNGATTVEAVDNGSNDVCGIQSAVLSQQSFSCADLGANSVTLTVTDVNDNASTCTATVTVEDNIDPEIECTDITVDFNGEDAITLDPSEMAEATDNCAITGLEAGVLAIDCGQIGETIPVTVTATDPGGHSAACSSNVTITGLPCGWMSMPDGIGCTNGNNGEYDPDAETFTLMASGCYTPSATADESGYIKYALCGDGSITAHIAGLTLPGYAGIVMRESDAPGAKKVAMAYQGVNALARYVRYTDNGPAYPSYINTPGSRWLRIVRTGNTFRGYHSVNGITWTYAFAVTVPMNNCIQIGLIGWGTNANSAVTATFDHVVVDPPFGEVVPRQTGDNRLPETFTKQFPTAEIWPNPTGGPATLYLGDNPDTEINIEIRDEFGRLIRNLTVDQAQGPAVDLDLSGQSPGIYFIRVTGRDGRMTTLRLIVARP